MARVQVRVRKQNQPDNEGQVFTVEVGNKSQRQVARDLSRQLGYRVYICGWVSEGEIKCQDVHRNVQTI